MEQIVKHIAERLVGLLPEDQEAYKLSDLRKNGFPKFVINRIEVELKRNLAESIILPETEWAEMESGTVRKAWDQFVSAIRAQARLPKSYVYPVVETAVSDIMDILVQPRKNLPDVIFGIDKKLEYDEVVERMGAIVVYRHFASLIPRYMEKKGLGELTKKQCSQIITQADEKLTAHYTPLNWAQMLEPLFLLTQEQIDSSLLRLFYEDRDMPRLARRFDMMNSSLNRSELIEELSHPDLPDEDEQNELFEQASQKSESNGWEGLVTPVKGGKAEKLTKEQQEVQDTKQTEEEDLEQHTDEDDGQALNSLFSEGAQPGDEEAEELQDEGNEGNGEDLNALFYEDPSEGSDRNGVSIEMKPANGQEKMLDRDPPVQEPGPEPTEDNAEPEEDEAIPEETDSFDEDLNFEDEEQQESTEQKDRAPMWQRFLDSEKDLQEETEDGQQEQEEAFGEKDELDEEEPLIDLTQDDKPDEEKINRLLDMLEDERERFVGEIFRGGEEAYEEALQQIVSKENWREASKYIDKEVFKRNLVDMYSEVAVDFTDRLQSYFLEISKSN